jgi:hypothetical protein
MLAQMGLVFSQTALPQLVDEVSLWDEMQRLVLQRGKPGEGESLTDNQQ